jgi:hypothetical protein
MSPTPLLETPQDLLLTLLWLTTDIIAFAFLRQTRKLFAGILTTGIFTAASAQRLRLSGWLIFAIGPLSVVVNLLSTMLLGYWRDPTKLSRSIDIQTATSTPWLSGW